MTPLCGAEFWFSISVFIKLTKGGTIVECWRQHGSGSKWVWQDERARHSQEYAHIHVKLTKWWACCYQYNRHCPSKCWWSYLLFNKISNCRTILFEAMKYLKLSICCPIYSLHPISCFTIKYGSAQFHPPENRLWNLKIKKVGGLQIIRDASCYSSD